MTEFPAPPGAARTGPWCSGDQECPLCGQVRSGRFRSAEDDKIPCRCSAAPLAAARSDQPAKAGADGAQRRTIFRGPHPRTSSPEQGRRIGGRSLSGGRVLPDEWRTILRASLAINDLDNPDNAARRWVPWLCAYTGARPGEMTQLRGADVIEREGIHGLRITSEAGTVKNNRSRVVPIHEHLIEQGFLEFVRKHGAGAIFYRVANGDGLGDPLNAKKPRYTQARQGGTRSNRSLTGLASASVCPTTSPDMHIRVRELATGRQY